MSARDSTCMFLIRNIHFFVLIFGPYLLVLKDPNSVLKITPGGLRELHGVPMIKPGLTVCKSSNLLLYYHLDP